MKITVVCQKCGKVLSIIEKDVVSDEDLNMYTNFSSCSTDDTYDVEPILDDDGNPILDDDGNPITQIIRNSFVVAVKTVN